MNTDKDMNSEKSDECRVAGKEEGEGPSPPPPPRLWRGGQPSPRRGAGEGRGGGVAAASGSVAAALSTARMRSDRGSDVEDRGAVGVADQHCRAGILGGRGENAAGRTVGAKQASNKSGDGDVAFSYQPTGGGGSEAGTIV